MRETFIYVIGSSPEGPVKIGYSFDPSCRIKKLQTGHADKLHLFYTQAIHESAVRKAERRIHSTINYRRIRGEWFNITVEEAIAEVKFGLMFD